MSPSCQDSVISCNGALKIHLAKVMVNSLRNSLLSYCTSLLTGRGTVLCSVPVIEHVKW